MTPLSEIIDTAEALPGLLEGLQRDPPAGVAPATMQRIADAVERLDVALADAWAESQRWAECGCSGYGNDPAGARRSPTCPVHGRDPDQARDMQEVAA